MKKSEIKLGKAYTDNSGNIREIVGVGPYLLYNGQANSDCVRYKILTKRLGPYAVGSERNCTRQSFASWAKEITKEV